MPLDLVTRGPVGIVTSLERILIVQLAGLVQFEKKLGTQAITRLVAPKLLIHRVDVLNDFSQRHLFHRRTSQNQA